MGEAKRRAAAGGGWQNGAAEKNGEAWIDDASAPVDVDTFRFAVEVWLAAANMEMPVVHPSAYGLPNSPANITIATVTKHLRESGIENPGPYITRLVGMGEVIGLIYDPAHPLADFAFTEEGTTKTEVDGALLSAMAIAKVIVRTNDRGQFLGFDLPDLIEKALAAREQMDSEQEPPISDGPRG